MDQGITVRTAVFGIHLVTIAERTVSVQVDINDPRGVIGKPPVHKTLVVCQAVYPPIPSAVSGHVVADRIGNTVIFIITGR